MLGLLLFRLVAIAALILGNGFFVAAEFALVSMRKTRLEQLIAEGVPGARTVERLQNHLDDFLPAVQFGVTLCSLALGWVGEPTIAELLTHLLGSVPHVMLYAHLIAAPVAFMIITYFHVLLGELVPKSLALRKGDQLAIAVAGPMLGFMQMTRPVVRLMNTSATWVLMLFRAPLSHEGGTVHSPDELKLIATAARRSGALAEFQESLIHRAVEANDIPTREIMTPRQRISLPSTMLLEEASARVVEEMHSRVPVYDPARGPEYIVGVVYSKDIARLMHFSASASTRFANAPFIALRLGQVMREVLVVPETKPVLALLREFQQRRRHLAIVVDEYGSTVGLVTVEDAMEQLIGEVDDEFDTDASPLLPALSEGLVLDGSVNLRDLETQMQWKLPRDGGVETLAGFLLARLGRIPLGGESVEFEGQRMTILEMGGHRIAKVRIEKIVPPAPESASDDEAKPVLPKYAQQAGKLKKSADRANVLTGAALIREGNNEAGTGVQNGEAVVDGASETDSQREQGVRMKRALRALILRLLYTIPVIWLVVSMVFLLVHLVPGDPVQQMLGEGARATDIAALRHSYGLDQPLSTQYLHYWRGVFHGDLGHSLRLNDSVTHLVLVRYPYTLWLTLAALILALVLAIPAGVAASLHRGRWQDHVMGVVSLLGLSFPGFALGPLMILLVSIKLGWLPVSGAAGPEYIILPAITMGSALAAILTRMVRTAMLEEMGQDYIRTARAKGLPERTVVYRHALRNALIPIITLVGLQFGALLAGAIVTEMIFSWPGIGRLTVSAISNRDYALVQGCLFAVGLTYVLVNLLTDVLYLVVNPRIRG